MISASFPSGSVSLLIDAARNVKLGRQTSSRLWKTRFPHLQRFVHDIILHLSSLNNSLRQGRRVIYSSRCLLLRTVLVSYFLASGLVLAKLTSPPSVASRSSGSAARQSELSHQCTRIPLIRCLAFQCILTSSFNGHKLIRNFRDLPQRPGRLPGYCLQEVSHQDPEERAALWHLGRDSPESVPCFVEMEALGLRVRLAA